MTAPPSSPSSLWPMDVALDAALLADAELSWMLAGEKLYNLRAPQGSPFPYLVLGDAAEADAPAFGAGGRSAPSGTLHIWTKPADKQLVATIWGRVRLALTRPLTANGWRVLLVRTALVGVLLETDDDIAHGVVQWSATVEPT